MGNRMLQTVTPTITASTAMKAQILKGVISKVI
jgi:hypothetical protein